MIGRGGHVLPADADMATLNARLDALADLVPLGVLLDEFAPIQCRVRWVEINPVPTEHPPCVNVASFEAMCRNCGAGGPTCAAHEQRISADPDVLCPRCMTQGAGCDVYVFVPLVP